MQLELVVNNEPRVLPSVRAFAHETLDQLGLPATNAQELEQLVVGAVQNAIEHAYREGEDGSIKLVIAEKQGKLEIRIRDYGVPQNIVLLEQQLHAGPSTTLFGCPTAGTVDEMHWLAFGPEGKALQILKWLHVTSVAEQADAKAMTPFRDDTPIAPEQQYAVERMAASEAVEVSQLMYRAYGNSYFNPDVYYPQRVAAQNANGSVISIVVRDETNSVVGHCALELNQAGPVAELGQAVVDPAHRGRGLLDGLKETAVQEAQQLSLVGWYADAVAVHTLTQKSNVTHGGHLTGVSLGISPKKEAFRGIAAEQPQRVTCLLYFHWLAKPAVRTVYVPSRHREIISAIYDNLQCPIELGEPREPSGHGTLAVRVESSAARAVVRAEQVGEDTVHAIRHAKRDLVERSTVEVVFVELPLGHPATPHVTEELENDGFGLAGVAPHFAAGQDLLRLVYLVEPLAREPIKTFEPFADRLVGYVLAEQARVQDAL